MSPRAVAGKDNTYSGKRGGRRASYGFAVEWIAYNDEPDEADVLLMSGLVSVALTADLFGKDPLDVAYDVIRERWPMDDQIKRAEARAFHEGFKVGYRGGLRGLNDHRRGQVWGADLRRSWDRGYDRGRDAR